MQPAAYWTRQSYGTNPNGARYANPSDGTWGAIFTYDPLYAAAVRSGSAVPEPPTRLMWTAALLFAVAQHKRRCDCRDAGTSFGRPLGPSASQQ